MKTADDIAQIKHALTGHEQAVAEYLLPGGKLDRREWRAGSVAGDEGQSLSVCLAGEKAGRWKDFATDEGGDLIDLWMSCRRLEMPAALDEIRDWLGLPKEKPAAPRAAESSRRRETLPPTGTPPTVAAIWHRASPIVDTVALRYLRSRGCADAIGGDLRYLPPSQRVPWPTMVSLVTDFVTGTPMSLHFTALTPDGSGKAPIEKPKRLLAGHRKAGGVIRLTDNADVTTELGIGEGIETSLAVAKALGPLRPVWSAIDAGNLKVLAVVPGIERLVIYADTDPSGTGQAAARALAARWHQAGREVFLAQPPAPIGGKADWNELGGRMNGTPKLVDLAASTVPFRPDDRPPDFTDEALALRYAELHADDLRFVATWGKWLHWSGTHWRLDDTLQAFDFAREVCREAAAAVSHKKAKLAAVIASAKTVAAIERLAKADRRLAATSDQWDSDPWLLNTPRGTLDLRSGNERPHNPSDHCTKSTAVSPEGECPAWLTFLARVTGGDADLQSFLQRVLGYALTGDTTAHALFFLFGHGANGKSVAIDTAAGIMGDYHQTAPIETFTHSTSERHPTELARLRGARLVTAVETEEGRRWAESRIKALTGGDKIAARFMRQDFFEFSPQFKLVIAGNHKPALRSVDEAIRRRFNLIPFSITIPTEERDPNLRDKLKAEWPGILRWLVEGCLAWQRQGLAAPAAVRDATSAYLDSEDATAVWLDERCIRDASAWSASADLFSSWKAWADGTGEFVGSAKRFAQNLETRGFQPARKMGGRGFQGLAIERPNQLNPHWTDR